MSIREQEVCNHVRGNAMLGELQKLAASNGLDSQFSPDQLSAMVSALKRKQEMWEAKSKDPKRYGFTRRFNARRAKGLQKEIESFYAESAALRREGKQFEKLAGVLPEFLAKPRREGFLDPRDDDFAKNHAFGRAVGMGFAPGALTTGLLLSGRRKAGIASLLSTGAVGGATYGLALKKFRKRQSDGRNPVTGRKHNVEQIERLLSRAKSHEHGMGKEASLLKRQKALEEDALANY